MVNRIRLYADAAAGVFRARSPQEREKQAAHLFALALVAAVATVKYVTGLTLHDARFTLYGIAIVVSAAHGGFAPALVATLASTLLGGLGVSPTGAGHPRLVFLAEGIAVALAVSAIGSRLEASEARVRTAEAALADLRMRLTAHEFARRREWDDYREAAARAQAALQQAADDTRRQLAALESLTDPSLNPLGGSAFIAELLERLRAAVGADGAALVQWMPPATCVVAAGRLQPAAGSGPSGAESAHLSPGRVAIVHNDPERVEQLSALIWSAGVTSLMVVPVVHNGEVRSTIEIVSERSRRASDWDVALVRVVADRLAAVVAHDNGAAAA